MQFFMHMTPMVFNLLIMSIILMPSKLNPPITLMSYLLILTFLMTLKMNFLSKSWLSYLLFLIIIGGLMIIFMYMVSMSNNQYTMMNFKKMKFLFLKLLLLMMLSSIMYFMIMPIFFYPNLKEITQINLSNLYELNKLTTFSMMMYLYLTMILIMNICFKIKSPLRQMMLYE